MSIRDFFPWRTPEIPPHAVYSERFGCWVHPDDIRDTKPGAVIRIYGPVPTVPAEPQWSDCGQ